MTRIALLTKYGSLAASTRQRFLLYRPYLEAEGFDLDPRPLLDNAYLEQLYERERRSFHHVAARYFDRLRWLIAGCDADILWLHCELLPYLPGFVEKLVGVSRVPVVYDFDDAIFHNYDLHRRAAVRAVLGRKLQPVLKASDLAMCGNAYLRDYAAHHCTRTEIVPTVLDSAHYRPANDRGESASPAIGWIGTPSTWRSYMEPMLPLLTGVAEAESARLRVVGSGAAPDRHPLVDVLPWTEAEEVQRIQEMQVGIMPLDDSPWARGKCGYKLIQYMACGLPVVASPVGVNSEIVEHGVNGFLARTEGEWTKALKTLIGDPELRRRMGAEGRKKVENWYSLQVQGPRVAGLLREAAERRPG